RPNVINLYNQHVESHKHNVFAIIKSLMHRNSKRESATPGHLSPVASPKSQKLGFHSLFSKRDHDKLSASAISSPMMKISPPIMKLR
ncbi:7747_t:CDS:1, partial [Acaulospora morrowiae]